MNGTSVASRCNHQVHWQCICYHHLMAFISTNFDVGVSCSSFVFKGIVYDVVHTRLESIMWGGSVQGRKIECLNGSCSMDSQVT